MGALPNSFPGYPSVLDDEAQKKFSEAYGVQMPQDMGLRIPEMFELAVHGTLKAMFIMGEDPALTDADANHVRKALENLDFLVVQNIFMTETAKYADVFLPAALYAEKDGTFTNTERRVQRVRKAVEPPGDTKPDWEIIQELGKRMGMDWDYDSPEAIFEEIRTAVPQYAGMTYERLGTMGLQWPCPDRGPSRHAVPAPGPVHARQGPAAGHPVPAARRARRRRVPDAAHHRAHALPLQHHDPALAEPRVAAALRAGRGQPGGRRAARRASRTSWSG